MLTKQLILSGEYLDSFDALPDGIRWDRSRIESSLAEMLSKRPPSGELWIFGYGSLLWNPLLDFDTRVPATLHGWHRSFCVHMVTSRASPETPGRMLALEPGGSAAGVAFRLSADTADDELMLLWIREMPTGAYCPTWTSVTLEDGTQITAIAFVADPECALYERDTHVAFIAPLIAAAYGPYGSNTDYVLKLESALVLCGAKDEYVEELADALKMLQEPRNAEGSP